MSATGELMLADKRGSLQCIDARAELIRGSFARDADAPAAPGKGGPATGTKAAPGGQPVSKRKIFTPSRGSAMSVSSVLPSPSGQLVALAGHSASSNCPVVRILDLSRTDPCRREEVNSKPPKVTEVVHAFDLGYSVFGTRPGLRVLHMEWHPASAHHLLVLTSASRLLLFDVRNGPEEPEMDLALDLSAAAGPSGATLGLSGASRPAAQAPGLRATSVSPAPGARSAAGGAHSHIPSSFVCGGSVRGSATAWSKLSVYILTRGGDVYAICPVCPGGARLAEGDVRDMREAAREVMGEGAPAAEEWLRACMIEDENGMAVADVGAMRRYAPAAQGPLEVCRSFPDEADGASPGDRGTADALVLLQHHMCVALVVASARLVSTYVLASEAMPVFADEARGPGPAPSNLFLMHMDSIACGSSAPVRSDALRAREAEHPSSDDDDFEDFGVDLAAGERWRSLLLPDRALPSRLFVVHATGALCVTLTWMPVVSSFLVRVARSDASSLATPAASLTSLPPPLCEPVLLDTPDTAAAASVGSELTGSALLAIDSWGGHAVHRPLDEPTEPVGAASPARVSQRGESLVPGGDRGASRSPRPASLRGGSASPAPSEARGGSLSPLARGVLRAGSGGAGQGAGQAGPSSAGQRAVLARKVEDQILQLVEERYRETLAGPRPVRMPEVADGLDAESPEGRRVLADYAEKLKEKYLAYATRAHRTLLDRAKAQREAAEELGQQALALAERLRAAQEEEASLAGRFRDRERLMDNVAERMDITASILDQVPRPLNAAQEAWMGELASLEERDLRDLEAEVARARHDAEALLKEARDAKKRGSRRAGGVALSGRALLTGLGRRGPSALKEASAPPLTTGREASAVTRAAQSIAQLWLCEAEMSAIGGLDDDGVEDDAGSEISHSHEAGGAFGLGDLVI